MRAFVVALLASVLITAQIPYDPSDQSCMDILFVTDYSDSIGQNNWDNFVIPFWRNFTASFPNNQFFPRFASIGFSNNAKIYFPYAQRTQAEVISLIDSMQYETANDLAGSTNLLAGMDLAATMLNLTRNFTQANRRQIVLLSDGEPNSFRHICCVGQTRADWEAASASTKPRYNICELGRNASQGVETIREGYGASVWVIGATTGNTDLKFASVECLASVISETGVTQLPAVAQKQQDDLAIFTNVPIANLGFIGPVVSSTISAVCSSFLPSVTGDPHFVTLDGLQYTFNGIGDFYLLNYLQDDFVMQIRTHRSGNYSAVISGIAIGHKGMRVVALWNGSDSSAITLIVNNTVVGMDTPEFTSPNVIAKRVTLPIGNALEVSLPSIGFRITLNYGGRSSFSAEVPHKWAGQTSGLLGNGNGNVRDDLTRPDGTRLPIATSLEELHFQFGFAWEVEVGRSLFSEFNYLYAHVSDLFNRYFVPRFEPVFADSVYQRKAEKLCKGDWACLYDAAATGSLQYAGLTLQDAAYNRQLSCSAPIVRSGTDEAAVFINSNANQWGV